MTAASAVAMSREPLAKRRLGVGLRPARAPSIENLTMPAPRIEPGQDSPSYRLWVCRSGNRPGLKGGNSE